MSGRSQLPSGEPRRASQRHARGGAHVPTAIAPTWRPGDRMHWRGYVGSFPRDVDDAEAEVLIATRTYLVRRVELQSA